MRNARNVLLTIVQRTGLLHAQFESIHPCLDGNGRIGRLMIALLLEHCGLLRAPLLYLSLFLKRHREEHYQCLNLVRLEGDWEGWVDFFLAGVATIADEAAASARELFNLVSMDRARLLDVESASVSALRLFERLPRHPDPDRRISDKTTGREQADCFLRDRGACRDWYSRGNDGKEARSQLCLSHLSGTASKRNGSGPRR
jgi:hypothetical protein